MYAQEEETEAQHSARASSRSSSSDSSQESQTPFAYLARGALPTLPSSKTPTPPVRRGSQATTGSFETTALVAFISPSAYQCQLLSLFINSISSAHQTNLAPTFVHYSNWLTEVAIYAESSSVLDWAVRTVSLSHLGRQVQDPTLIHTSRQLYRSALLRLNAALQDPIEGLSSETLSATILLSCYELLNCTERDSWIRHAGGAGHIMRLRGPERHRTGHGRAIFLAYRNSLVIEAFLARKSCFLDTPPWRALSEEIHRTSPSYQDPVLKVAGDFFLEIVSLPGFNRDAQLARTGDVQENLLQELISRARTHRSKLKALKIRIDDALKQTNQERTEHPSATNDVLFPVVYHYADILIASLHCGHNVMSQLANTSLVRLESKLSDPHHPAPSASTLIAGRGLDRSLSPQLFTPAYDTRSATDMRNRHKTYVAETIACARDSCRSAEYMTTSAFLGPLYLVFALRSALFVLEGEEKEWVLKKMEDVSVNLGIAKAIADAHRTPGIP